ncbi:coniferyl alcohol acyltransferase-like [Hibiscus syriacus]|uniref:coniferyl alcohol acyltransferase-like n=1 Tax=Hibiscus syriacus TaxID=106335 RepID=UPI001922CF3E|nr:coniferyl alcohol acyltransferase-like [Hibiscus syriacus]XP_039052494.1 coniferyl alcohol acyltransferase-like [Hibiscus syriacus]
MGAKTDFTMTVSKEETVAAGLPLQEHWLPFSNLDLLLPSVDVGVFFFYDKPETCSTSFPSMVSVLKKSLSQALVSYYAFAGEVVTNTVGEPELLCNNRGVDFVEAYADVELRNLDLHNPDETIEGKLVPKKKHGVLSVQATELRCGGTVVACTFDHRIADAYSANMFLVSWSEMARSKSMSSVPSFRRSLMNPRYPGRIDVSLDRMYVPISSLPPPKRHLDQPTDTLISRIYYVASEKLNDLQSLACSDGYKRTKLESFSAFLWKMVALLAAKDGFKFTKMGIVVDGRVRLGEGDEDKASLMSSYFGNVLSIPFGGQSVNDLIEKPLSWVANQVHDFLDQAVTKEHFLGLIDWVEAHRPEPALAKIYSNGSDEGPAFVVSSGQRFPVSKVDFGWGRPVFGSYHFPWGGDSGYVMPMPSPAREGDWVVYVHLFKRQLELIEAEAGNVLRPLAFDYLQVD